MTASKDEQRELEALLEWLQTFPKFAETYQESEEQENDNNDDKLAIFGQIRPALYVLDPLLYQHAHTRCLLTPFSNNNNNHKTKLTVPCTA